MALNEPVRSRNDVVAAYTLTGNTYNRFIESYTQLISSSVVYRFNRSYMVTLCVGCVRHSQLQYEEQADSKGRASHVYIGECDPPGIPCWRAGPGMRPEWSGCVPSAPCRTYMVANTTKICVAVERQARPYLCSNTLRDLLVARAE